MEFFEFSLNDWLTLGLIIAQAGIVYYRLTKVEEKAERFNELIIEFAVQKNSLKHHRDDYEKQSFRIERIIQKLEDRVAGIETQAIETLLERSRALSD
jgi:hypothetical protein